MKTISSLTICTKELNVHFAFLQCAAAFDKTSAIVNTVDKFLEYKCSYISSTHWTILFIKIARGNVGLDFQKKD